MSPKGDIRGLPGGRLSAPPAVKGLKIYLSLKLRTIDVTAGQSRLSK